MGAPVAARREHGNSACSMKARCRCVRRVPRSGTVATTGIFPWNGKSNGILRLLNRRLRSNKQPLCSVVYGTRTEPAIKPHLCSIPTFIEQDVRQRSFPFVPQGFGSRAQDDRTPSCHPERSEGSLAALILDAADNIL